MQLDASRYGAADTLDAIVGMKYDAGGGLLEQSAVDVG